MRWYEEILTWKSTIIIWTRRRGWVIKEKEQWIEKNSNED
jgi:hypothetical protein